MFNEYINDIEILCNKASLTEEQTEAVRSFAKDASDNPTLKPKGKLLVSAIREFKMQGLLPKFIDCIKTPKSWNTDFDGENGIPY